jgi:hypothetical protein
MSASTRPAPRSAPCSTPRSTSSDRKKAANRDNARKSTGPRTEAGKARSSRNALRHGFYAESVAIGDQEKQEFESFSDTLIRDLNPRDMTEFTQIERIAALQWRIGRIQKAQTALLETEQLRVFKSIRQSVDRLEAVREQEQDYDPEDRTFTEREQDHIELSNELYRSADDVEPAHALMTLAGDESAALERLSRLEQRLDTQLQRAWKQLKVLQDPEREIVVHPSPLIEAMDRRSETEQGSESDSPPDPASAPNEATDIAILEDPTVYEADRGMALQAVSCRNPAKGHGAGQSPLASQVLQERSCE